MTCSTQRLPSFAEMGPAPFRAPRWALPFLMPFLEMSKLNAFWHPMTFFSKPLLPLREWITSCFNRAWLLYALYRTVSLDPHCPCTRLHLNDLNAAMTHPMCMCIRKRGLGHLPDNIFCPDSHASTYDLISDAYSRHACSQMWGRKMLLDVHLVCLCSIWSCSNMQHATQH